MPVPVDKTLYAQASREVKQKMPDHSAYRSGHIVQKYKQKFRQKYGPSSVPYLTAPSKQVVNTGPTGLTRWFREKWRNQRGGIGYTFKNDIYRPSIRVTSKTPVLLKELTNRRIGRARTMKYKKGRVDRF